MDTSIGYRGKVTIKGNKNKPSKGTKNAGTLHLFKNLANILARTYSAEDTYNATPAYIDFISGDYQASGPTPEGILNSRIQITTRQVSGNTTVVLRGLLTNAKLPAWSSSYTTNGITAILLSNIPEVIAYSKLSADDVTDLQAVAEDINGQATVEWEMTFENHNV